MFVAGLEFVSEVFVSGVEIGGEVSEQSEKGLVAAKRDDMANGQGGVGTNGVAKGIQNGLVI